MTTLALAGAGWVAAVHGMAAGAADGVEVGLVAGRTAAGAARRAAQAGGTPCRLDDLPGDADAVVVATPPVAHRREAERAVDGGAAVLVETPLAATLDDADHIVALAGRGRVAYAENLVHSPVVAEAVRACRQMGNATHLEVRFAQGPPDPGSARLDPAWGGGALFDLGVHAVTLALLMAAPARVVAVAEADITPAGGGDGGGGGGGVDHHAVVDLAFDTGLRAEVRASWGAAAPTWDAQAASPTSAVRLELVPEPVVELNGAALRLPRPPDGLATDQLYHLGYVGQLTALAADLHDGRPPQPPASLGLLALEVVCAAYAAARSGRLESVPFAGDRTRTPHQLWRG